uniref:Uncharacterized protein n=1 Tax=Lygus hesperus TaxID=30085 RepID=A0A0K8SAG9_LYGHE
MPGFIRERFCQDCEEWKCCGCRYEVCQDVRRQIYGTTDNELTIITASKCLVRVPAADPQEGNLTTTMKPYDQFVMSSFDHKSMAIRWVEPGKSTDAPYEGFSKFPDFATLLANVVPPGIEVKASDDNGTVMGKGPTYTPWPVNQSEFERLPRMEVTGIVVGVHKAAMMKVMTEKACDERLFSIKEAYAFMNAVEQRPNGTRDHFCAVSADSRWSLSGGLPLR